MRLSASDRWLGTLFVAAFLAACSDGGGVRPACEPPFCETADGSVADAGVPDGSVEADAGVDAGVPDEDGGVDAGDIDAGGPEEDGGVVEDGGTLQDDGGTAEQDGGPTSDGGNPAVDGGTEDGGTPVISLLSITVAPDTVWLQVGDTRQLTATGHYSDGSASDLTATIAWSSDSPVATASAGFVTAVSAGVATVTASSDGISGTATVLVGPLDQLMLAIVPESPVVAAGLTLQLRVIAPLPDGSERDVSSLATWSSADPSIATISTTGLVTGRVQGTTTITATNGTASVSVLLTVAPPLLASIALEPAEITLAKGSVRLLTVIGTFSDGSTQPVTAMATWASDSSAIAAVSSDGTLSGVGQGSTHVTALVGDLSAQASVTVLPPEIVSISVTAPSNQIAAGLSLQLTAVATLSDGATADVTADALWAPSEPLIATVTRGLVQTLIPGNLTVTATVGTVVGSINLVVASPDLVSIEISAPTTSVPVGRTLQLGLIGHYTDGTTLDLTEVATWFSSDATASVPAAGVVTGEAVGPATINATFGVEAASLQLTVTDAVLDSIVIAPANPVIPNGRTLQLTARGVYSDGSQRDLNGVTWSSADTSVATVSAGGLVRGLTQGTVVVSATSGGVTGSVTVTIAAPELVSIATAPTFQAVPKGRSTTLSAFGTYSDGTTADITSSVNWSSAQPNIATVSAGGAVQSLAQGTASIKAWLGDISSSAATVVVTAPEVESLTISPNPASVPLGLSQEFKATGNFTDGATSDLTASVTWGSSQASVASIASTGKATTLSVGTTTITATIGTLSATASLTVEPAAIQVLAIDPSQQSIALGRFGQVTVHGTYTDGSLRDVTNLVSWTFSVSSVTSIDATGAVRSTGLGTTTITAALNGVTGAATVTVTPAELVSITVTPVASNVPKGLTQQLTAVGTYTDGTTQDLTSSANWTSSNSGIASVDVVGSVTAIGTGVATITASVEAISGAATVTVTPPVLVSLAISPENASFPLGTSQSLVATGTLSDGTTSNLSNSVTWTVDDPLIAMVTPAGLATGLTTGTVTVRATLGEISSTTELTVGEPELVSLSIAPRNGSVAKGLSLQLSATGIFTDGSVATLTAVVDWTSSDDAIAAFSAPGKVEGKGVGQVTVTATSGTVSATTRVTVNPPALTSIVVTPAHKSVPKGISGDMTAIGHFSDGSESDLTTTVTWSTSDALVASISGTGHVVAEGIGQATLTATLGAVAGSTTLTVTPAQVLSLTVEPVNPSVALGLTLQLHATAVYTDGPADVTEVANWTSGDSGVATVSGGLITTAGVGFSSITASLGGQSDSTLVQVLPPQVVSIALSPLSPQLPKGDSLQLVATATYTDGSRGDLPPDAVWTSSNVNVASVNNGLLKGLFQGLSVITVAADGVEKSTVATVTAAQLRSIAVTPSSTSIAKGRKTQLVATGTYSDGTTQNLTSVATWTSSDSTVASVSSTALVTGVAPGATTVTASYGELSGSAQITVTAPVIESIAVTPANGTIPRGTRVSLVATGTFSDGSTSDLSEVVLWSSSVTSIATISSVGVVQGNNQGTTTITAIWSGVSGTTTVTVGPAALETITITPSSPVLQPGASVTLTATGSYSDGTTADLSNTASWFSDASVVASLSGHTVTGNSSGTATITATVGSVQGSTVVTVASLVSIAVTPSTATVRTGASQQFTATATYSDGSTRNVSSSATWSSNDTTVATVSTSGLALGKARGSATIRATIGAVSGPATLTVKGPDSIVITPANPRLPVGGTRQLTATATYSDGTTVDVTNAVTWSSNDSSLAAVSSTGLVSALQAGVVTISATDGTIVANDNIIILSLASISVTPANQTISRGATQQLTATGTYSDGVTQDLTAYATWSSVTSSVATVSTSGLATGVASGTTTIKATIGAISGSTSLTVGNPTLVRIVVSPIGQVQAPKDCTVTGGTVPLREDMQLRATGILTDGTTQDLSLTAIWQTSNSNIGIVSSSGYFQTVATGTVAISATSAGVTGTISITVQ